MRRTAYGRHSATDAASYAILTLAIVVACAPALSSSQDANSWADWGWPHQAAYAAGEPAHLPPLQQDVGVVQCNEPREAYMADSRALCLFPGTFEALAARGIELVKCAECFGPSHLDLTTEEEEWLGNNPVIRVSYDPYWFPIEYEDKFGQLAGITLDYIVEFEALVGVDFEPIPIDDWSHALDTIRERSSDATFMVSPTDQRSEYMGFTTSHYTVGAALTTLDDVRLEITDPGLRVLTVRDYSTEDWLDEHHPDVEYASVDNFVQGLQMLQAGEADAFAASWPVISSIAEREGITVYNAGPIDHVHPLTVGYRSDQPVLGSILQKALDAIPESTLERIQGKVVPSAPGFELTSEEILWLDDNPTVLVSYDPFWFPIEYVDESGNLAGVTLAYMEEFERVTGLDFEPADIEDWSHALASMQDGSSDVIIMVAHTPQRAEYMGFTTPHYTVGTSLATINDVSLDMTEPGLRVLTPRDYAIETWLDEHHPDVEYASVDSFVQGLQMLQAGEADAFAASWPVISSIAEREGITVYNAGPIDHVHPLTVGYRSDQPVLGSILQKALDAIPESTLETLHTIPAK